MTCAMIEIISSIEFPFETIAPRYLKLESDPTSCILALLVISSECSAYITILNFVQNPLRIFIRAFRVPALPQQDR